MSREASKPTKKPTAGSEQLSTRWLNEATHFACCGRPINPGKRGSLLQLVAETRTDIAYREAIGYGTTRAYCMECREAV